MSGLNKNFRRKVVAVASDHAGNNKKMAILDYFEEAGIPYEDLGCYSNKSCDYPDFAHKIAEAIEEKEFECGISFCGSGQGINITASYTRKLGEVNIELRGNFTLTRDKILDYDEPPVQFSYLARQGSSNDVTRGLIALGLFKDEDDVRNSPTHFGDVLPGDIKYQDVNGDGIINDYDIVPIGNARIPKSQYGFAGSMMWKGIDFNIFFRGQAKADFFFGGTGFYPFSGGERGNVLTIVNDPKNRWIPTDYAVEHGIDLSLAENPNAKFPRLTYGDNINNNRPSTFWLTDASFLRLKTLEIGYSLPQKMVKRIALNNFRISVIGDNLYLWDKVKLWDPEQASSNGAVYPLTRSWSLVLQLSL